VADRKDDSFAESVGEVKPLAGRGGVLPPDAGVGSAARIAASEPGEEALALERPQPEQPLLGYVRGIDRSTFRRLRAGRIEPERRVDLHGQRAEEARQTLTRELARAWQEGLRCLVVIHGRGLHSDCDPVLKRQLPAWLTRPPNAALLLAVAPARAEHGGEGATYVLLRRRRPEVDTPA
jgi:DNA-nicking Smr family endonuclease